MSIADDSPTADWAGIARVQNEQDGVIARSQVLAFGARQHDIRRLLRRRIWVRMLPGVFLDHTGDPTWLQRAWAGVLYYAPAVLTHTSAVRMVQAPGWKGHRDGDRIEIAVAATRMVEELAGYRVVRTRGFEERAQWNCHPPRMRFEEAVIDVAAEASTELGAVSALADACQSRRTTARRLLRGLAGRARISRRPWLEGVLSDIADGTCSVLEHAFLARVERPHGLPRGNRQPPATSGGRRMYRDVDYDELDFIVELDGRIHHEGSRPRDHDMERDLDAAVGGRHSIRLGWGQCVQRPCTTAGKLGAILQQHGWQGSPVPCGAACPV